MPVCDDTLKHSVYKYDIEDIDAIILREKRIVEIIRLTLIKYHILVQIFDFCIKSNEASSKQFLEKISLKEQDKINRIIKEFKYNISKQQFSGSIDEYELTTKSMQTITKNFNYFNKIAAKIIAKHYFKILKDKFQMHVYLNLK